MVLRFVPSAWFTPCQFIGTKPCQSTKKGKHARSGKRSGGPASSRSRGDPARVSAVANQNQGHAQSQLWRVSAASVRHTAESSKLPRFGSWLCPVVPSRSRKQSRNGRNASQNQR